MKRLIIFKLLYKLTHTITLESLVAIFCYNLTAYIVSHLQEEDAVEFKTTAVVLKVGSRELQQVPKCMGTKWNIMGL